MKDKKIAIYRKQGGAWELICSSKLWAHYRQLSGKEVFAARTAGFTDEVAFTVNWHKDITPGVHIIFRDTIYEATRVDDFEGYKKDLRLTCKHVPYATLSDYPPAG